MPKAMESIDPTSGKPAIAFYCAPCRCLHVCDERWKFNGDFERPTLYPSVDRKLGPIADPKWAREHGVAPGGIARCHSWVKDGMIEYLSDCTHPLVGKTVPLEEIPAERKPPTSTSTALPDAGAR